MTASNQNLLKVAKVCFHFKKSGLQCTLTHIIFLNLKTILSAISDLHTFGKLVKYDDNQISYSKKGKTR